MYVVEGNCYVVPLSRRFLCGSSTKGEEEEIKEESDCWRLFGCLLPDSPNSRSLVSLAHGLSE